jgi:hypothetical protein
MQPHRHIAVNADNAYSPTSRGKAKLRPLNTPPKSAAAHSALNAGPQFAINIESIKIKTMWQMCEHYANKQLL